MYLPFSDLYANKIQLFLHNFTNLPKALVRMWVKFLLIVDSFVVKYTADLINFHNYINFLELILKY